MTDPGSLRHRSPAPGRRRLSQRLAPPFRSSFVEVRASLSHDEQPLFDLLCLAGHLGRSLPNTNANIRTVSGSRDPRRQLQPLLAASAGAGWRMRPTGCSRRWFAR
jgi:hypothetical protein